MTFEVVFHKLDYNKETEELLEDKIFFMVNCTNIKGTLIEEFEGGRNVWMTLEEYEAQRLNFADTKKSFEVKVPGVPVIEDRYSYDPTHY